jgi:hypothetical protein
MPCRASKKRCDSKTPCSSCIRRDCEIACVHNRVSQHADRATPTSRGRRQTAVQRFRENTIRSVRPSSLSIDERLLLRQTQQVETQPNIAPAFTVGPSGGLLSDEPPRSMGRQYDDADECDINMPASNCGTASSLIESSSLPRSRLMLSANGEKGKHYFEQG